MERTSTRVSSEADELSWADYHAREQRTAVLRATLVLTAVALVAGSFIHAIITAL